MARPLLFVALAAALALLLIGPSARALDVPPLTGRVVDGARLLTPEAKARIEGLLAAQERDTGQQFALLTVPSLDGEPIENFSIAVVDKWQLGKKGKDDGLLLLVVPNDRRVRIEVGRGLEGDVTDAVSARIIRNVIGPAFRSGDYAGGIEQAFSALMRAASGKVPDVPDSDTSPEPERTPLGGFALLLLILVPMMIALSRSGRRGSTFLGGPGYGGGFGGGGYRGGGGGGGGGGGFSGGGGGFGGGGASGSW